MSEGKRNQHDLFGPSPLGSNHAPLRRQFSEPRVTRLALKMSDDYEILEARCIC